MNNIKNDFSGQSLLNLSINREKTLPNFYNGNNEKLVAHLLQFLNDDDNEKIFFIWGDKGMGKSHLLQAATSHNIEKNKIAFYLPLDNPNRFSIDMLKGIENSGLLCIDDIHNISNNHRWEESIFHLLNKTWENGGKIIVSADKQKPDIRLPDLLSRLQWGQSHKLHENNDQQKSDFIRFFAELRGFQIKEDATKFILNHYSRNMNDLALIMEKLDKETLSHSRKASISFIKMILNQ
ncbi:MAG: DnaA regulatory inactivator Hda [Gammaproteobacteria bacterium]|nr:MAG: DnaA regulatory inactivator Hda [Gammaproteobacteria bacterium]